MAARTLLKVLRAGSGTATRYPSMFFGAVLRFAAEPRLPDFVFFIRAMLRQVALNGGPFFVAERLSRDCSP